MSQSADSPCPESKDRQTNDRPLRPTPRFLCHGTGGKRRAVQLQSQCSLIPFYSSSFPGPGITSRSGRNGTSSSFSPYIRIANSCLNCRWHMSPSADWMEMSVDRRNEALERALLLTAVVLAAETMRTAVHCMDNETKGVSSERWCHPVHGRTGTRHACRGAICAGHVVHVRCTCT